MDVRLDHQEYPDAHASGVPVEHYGPEDALSAAADTGALVGAVDGSWRGLGGGL